jgi:hypothetical protein
VSFDAYKLESTVDRNPLTRPIREQRFRLDQLATRSRPAYASRGVPGVRSPVLKESR